MTTFVPVPKSLHKMEFLETPFVLNKYMQNGVIKSLGGGLVVKIFLSKLFRPEIYFYLGKNSREVNQKKKMFSFFKKILRIIF